MLVSSCFMTGCSSKKNELMNYRVKASGTAMQITNDTTQDYLSKDICVIPKKGADEKAGCCHDSRCFSYGKRYRWQDAVFT